MKKLLNLLLIAVMIMTSTVIGVKAEGMAEENNEAVTGDTATQGVTATVDEVPETTYGATITWGDLEYDWVNLGGTLYGWQAKEVCKEITYVAPYFGYESWSTTQGVEEYNQFLNEHGEEANNLFWQDVENVKEINTNKVYTDSSCQTKAINFNDVAYNKAVFSVQTDPVEMPRYTVTYYAMVPTNQIKIIDESVAGSIVPTFEWTPTAKYYYTAASTQYFLKYSDEHPIGITTISPGHFTENTLNSATIPNIARVNMSTGGYDQLIGYKLNLLLDAQNVISTATSTNATASNVATGTNAGAKLSRYYKPATDDTIGTLTIHLSAAE